MVGLDDHKSVISFCFVRLGGMPFGRKRFASSFGILVGRNYQGKGLGSKMLGHMVDWARRNNLTEVRLRVFGDNRTAINLYRKFGFRFLNALKEFRGSREYRMVLKL